MILIFGIYNKYYYIYFVKLKWSFVGLAINLASRFILNIISSLVFNNKYNNNLISDWYWAVILLSIILLFLYGLILGYLGIFFSFIILNILNLFNSLVV